jgi:hypothetical protein
MRCTRGQRGHGWQSRHVRSDNKGCSVCTHRLERGLEVRMLRREVATEVGQPPHHARHQRGVREHADLARRHPRGGGRSRNRSRGRRRGGSRGLLLRLTRHRSRPAGRRLSRRRDGRRCCSVAGVGQCCQRGVQRSSGFGLFDTAHAPAARDGRSRPAGHRAVVMESLLRLKRANACVREFGGRIHVRTPTLARREEPTPGHSHSATTGTYQCDHANPNAPEAWRSATGSCC